LSSAQSPNVVTKIRQLAKQFQFYIIAFVFVGIWPPCILAQDGHSHAAPSEQELTSEQQNRASALIKIVRESTERFKDVAEAEREGYALQFGCVSGPDQGAMGLHFINMDLVGKGIIDATKPQIILYEPTADGRLKLTGADFLVDAKQWDDDKTHKPGPPELYGQLFHYFESPNRFGFNAFYTLHVWAWKDNANGAFVNWHPKVSCKLFNVQTP
jgi:hypothetical protein